MTNIAATVASAAQLAKASVVTIEENLKVRFLEIMLNPEHASDNDLAFVWDFMRNARNNNCKRNVALMLFADKPKGFTTAAAHLFAFVHYTLMARIARKDGKIETALRHEKVANFSYNALPIYARTW